MKVVYILGSLNRGGMESLLLDVARQHDAAPFDMVVLHRKGGAYYDDYYGCGVDIRQIAFHKGRLITYILSLSRFFAEKDVDVVHTQMAIDCIYARLALRLGRLFGIIHKPIQLVTTFHGFDMGEKGFNRMRRKWAIRMADKVCFVSQYEREDYERRYDVGNKGYVIYNGVDFSKVAVKMERGKESERESESAPIHPRLGMVGSFGSGRSHIVVCKALKELRDRNIKIEFYFAGAKRESEAALYDTCVDYCRQNNLNNVHFLGNCNDVYGLLQQMDGFVYSTVHDTFGIAVVEAMATGLPTIVNDWVVMKEVTRDGQWATLFKTEDAEDCANKIQDLIEHLSERKVTAKEIAQQVRKVYSIEKHIERLNEIYAEVSRKGIVKNE